MTGTPRFCGKCGARLSTGAKFCGSCGEAVPAGPVGPKTAPDFAPPKAARDEAWKTRRLPKALWLVAGGIALALVAVFVAMMDRPGQAVPSGSGHDWRTYTNTRYGVVVDYPAALFMTMEDEPEDHSGRGFSGADNIRFFVYSSANALDLSNEKMRDQVLLGTAQEQIVSSALRADGFDAVLRREGEIVRHHLLTSENGTFLHWLQIGWPESEEARLAPVAAKMIASFRVDPSIPEKAAGNAPDYERGPDEFGFQRIKSRAFGFAVDGARGGGSFEVEIPQAWVREEASGLANELAFKSPDDDPDAKMSIAFTGKPAAGRSAKDLATAHGRELQEIGDAKIIESKSISIGPYSAYRLLLKVVSPSNIGTMLVDELVVIERDDMLFLIEMTAPEPIWHTAGQATEKALESLIFQP